MKLWGGLGVFSQTLEPNFLWCFVVLSGTFRSVLNIF